MSSVMNLLPCCGVSTAQLQKYESVQNYSLSAITKEVCKTAMLNVAGVCYYIAMGVITKGIFQLGIWAFSSIPVSFHLGVPVLSGAVTFFKGLGAAGICSTFVIPAAIGAGLLTWACYEKVRDAMLMLSYVPENWRLRNLAVLDVRQVLEQKGIAPDLIPGVQNDQNRLLELKPLIAALNYHETHVKECESALQTLLLSNPNSQPSPKDLDTLRGDLFKSKMRAAFLHASICNPLHKIDLYDVYSIATWPNKNISEQTVAIANFCHSHSCPPNRSLLWREVQGSSIAELSARIQPRIHEVAEIREAKRLKS